MTTIQPADYVVVPFGGGGGPFIEAAEQLAITIQMHKLGVVQKYGHAEIYVGMPDKAGPYGYTYSAYGDGNGKRALPCPAAELPGGLWSSGVIKLTPQQREGILAWCLAHPNVPYSPEDYVAIAEHTLGVDTVWLENYIKDQHHMICSQYTDTAYNVGGNVHLFTDGRWEGFVMPLDLALRIEGGESV